MKTYILFVAVLVSSFATVAQAGDARCFWAESQQGNRNEMIGATTIHADVLNGSVSNVEMVSLSLVLPPQTETKFSDVDFKAKKNLYWTMNQQGMLITIKASGTEINYRQGYGVYKGQAILTMPAGNQFAYQARCIVSF